MTCEVWVPATLANLGSGFDALGAALDLYLHVKATPAQNHQFIYHDQWGQGGLPHYQSTGTDIPDNLVHQGYTMAWKTLFKEAAPAVCLEVYNPIPLARGMGSSSAALVAGAAIADIFSGGKLTKDGVFKVTAGLEGHPDNVAPAVYGGFVTALADPPIALPLPKPDLCFVVGVPGYNVPTPLARAALPETVPLADAVFNLSRSALWPAALYSGRLEVLREASKDRLHQQYRRQLMPGLYAALDALYAAGALAAFVGGAGPTVAALTQPSQAPGLQSAFADYVGTGKTLVLPLGKGLQWKAA
jgi:homoserine kinase